MSKKVDIRIVKADSLKQKAWGSIPLGSLAVCIVGLGVVAALNDGSNRYVAGEVANILTYTCVVLAIVSIVSIVKSRAKVRVLSVACFLLIIAILFLSRAMYWITGI